MRGGVGNEGCELTRGTVGQHIRRGINSVEERRENEQYGGCSDEERVCRQSKTVHTDELGFIEAAMKELL
jgi:hypothetical protein